MQIRSLLHRGSASALKSDRRKLHGGWFESLESRCLLSTSALPTDVETAHDTEPRYFIQMHAKWRRAPVYNSPAAPKSATPANGSFSTQSIQANDTIIFGDSASETNHTFTQTNSQVIAGALAQPARQLLPKPTVEVNGGDMTFTMAVDPVNRNYFTIKLWGGDDIDADKGRLYLYVPVGGVNYQVGYRHEGDYVPLSISSDKPLPGRFFYSTTLLPLSMTRGKTSLTLKIISTGRLYGLGTGAESTGGNYQFNMKVPSRGIYRAYTHTQPLLDVSGETQGAAPATTTRPETTEASILGPTGTYTTGLNGWINGRLAAANNAFIASDVELLARSYSVSQLSAGYQNAAIVTKIIAVIDGFTSNYYANPTTSTNTNTYGADGGNEVWGGRFGSLGQAIHLLAAQLQGSLDTTVDYGSGQVKTRRLAWGDMLLASRDFGRFNRDSRYITNQTILADRNIYKANKGMLALGDSRAFTETAAQRYIKEAVGLLPWVGSDLAGGGSSLKCGSNYYQVTDDGLTREWGYVGGYGEMQRHVADFYQWTGNVAFRDQAIKIGKALSRFRRPAVHVSGTNNWRSMERIGALAWRGGGDPLTNEVTYGDPTGWSAGMRTAGVTGDPTLIGYAKQMLADNQYLPYLVADNRYYRTLTFDALGAMDVYDDYNAVKNAADNGARLPMTDGQPDFAWADEQNGIIAIKQGNERLWVEPYWQAKTGTGVSGVGMFVYSTPSYEQYGAIETNAQFTSTRGATFVRPNVIDKPEGNGYVPPDNPSNAYAGEKLPLGNVPADAKDGTPFRGKVDFYALRYGRYLIGLNTGNAGGTSRSYELKLPAGVTSALDLVSGATKSGPVMVAPGTTVVLELSDTHDAAPAPTAPLLLQSSGSATQVSLEWSATSGAATYNVKRATSAGGPYTTVATNITGTTYADTTVAAGTVYYYAVTASNANGESHHSMESVISAGLPAPWGNQDVGTVSTAGSANVNAGVYTVRGSGSDIGGTADALHFAHQSMAGDGTIVARLAALTIGGANNDKVGLMMRETLAANAKSVAMLLDMSSSTARQAARSAAGGGTIYTNGPAGVAAPTWFKLQRAGNTFTGSVSSDGISWTVVTSSSVTMTGTIYVGLAVCSRDQAALNASTFDSVQMPGSSNAAPTVATPASASPATVSGITTNLSVLGADENGEPNLIYTWSASGPAAVTYSANGNNAAKNSTATFFRAGNYAFTVTIRDAGGLTTTSNVSVTVNQTLTNVDVNPSAVTISPNGTQQFAATALDQFGQPMTTQPSFTWSVPSGGGTINGSGLYTAPGATGAATVQVTTGLHSDTAAVTIASNVPAAPSGLAASSVSASQINLTWTDNASNETGFTIERATDSAFTTNLVTSTAGANVTSHSATGLSAGTTYYFRVRATNGAESSANSNTASATTSAASPQILQQSTGTGNKMEVKNGQRGAQSFRHGTAGTTYQVTKLVLKVSRESQVPDANFIVSIGTGINTGTVAGTSTTIAPSTITNTSAGVTFQTLEVVFAAPVTLNGNQTYYLNFQCDAPNGKPIYLQYATSSTYANGTYYKGGSDDGKDVWFQLFGF